MQVHLFSLDSSRILFYTPLRDICLVVKFFFIPKSVGYEDKKMPRYWQSLSQVN
jgi:hypothetical protein